MMKYSGLKCRNCNILHERKRDELNVTTVGCIEVHINTFLYRNDYIMLLIDARIFT